MNRYATKSQIASHQARRAKQMNHRPWRFEAKYILGLCVIWVLFLAIGAYQSVKPLLGGA